MRLKLLIIVSLLAAIVGSGASIAIVLGIFASLKPLTSPTLALSTLILPIAAIAWASIFVYRHTARRRKTQAILTALLSLILTFASFALAALLTAKPSHIQPEPISKPRNVG
jgi:hypothetical protein